MTRKITSQAERCAHTLSFYQDDEKGDRHIKPSDVITAWRQGETAKIKNARDKAIAKINAVFYFSGCVVRVLTLMFRVLSLVS